MVGLLLFSTAKLAGQSSEQDILKEANLRFDQGRYADAMPLFAQLLSLNSSNPEFHFKYGATALYGDADKKQEAIKNLRFAAGKPGVDPLCWYYLGRAYHINYQFADAIKAYEKFRAEAPKQVEAYQVQREIEACQNGQLLLSKIKEVVVLDKKQSTADAFFRLYDLSDIGGKILVTPDELLSPLDKKRNHKSLIHFRGAGGTVYFSSYGKDGKTGLDIYRADMLPDGNFSQPVALGPNINTPYDEDYPYMHPDDKSFFFSSKGHKGMGGYDVYRSSFNIISGAFGSPENLDFAINTPDDDIFYIVDSRHALANFASARSSRQGELHVYKVEVSNVPLNITLIKGAFANKVVPANKTAKITLTDAATNAEIEAHYTDPKSGDYLLSFPKAGRYKLLIEVQGSNMVHSGQVDIPKGNGISAYLQEMELITSAGMEKLIINNLFDKQYDGDIAALAQNLLRQKAALDVNFYGSAMKVPVAALESAKSPEMAYSDAGFSAGMSNKAILDQADERAGQIENQNRLLNDYIAEAENVYTEAFTEAQKKTTETEQLYVQAQRASGDEQGKLMFEAAMASVLAKDAIEKAENTRLLVVKLEEKEAHRIAEYNTAKAQADSLRQAIGTNDYDIVLAALKREKSIRKGEGKLAQHFDPVDEVRKTGISAQAEAGKKMERATALRNESTALRKILVEKESQRKLAKGRQATQLDEEIARLKEDLEAADNTATKLYIDAEKLQENAHSETQQYEILALIKEQHPDRTTPLTRKPGSLETAAKNTGELMASMNAVKPDKAAIAGYLAKYPDAIAKVGDSQTQRTFAKAYIDDESLIATLADTNNKDANENSEDSATSETNPRAKSDNAKPTSEQKNPSTGATGNAGVTIVPGATTAVLPSVALSEADLSKPSTKTEKEAVNQNISETPALASNEKIASAAVTENKTPDAKAATTKTVQPKSALDVETEKLNQARDWVKVLDESIVELNSGKSKIIATEKAKQLESFEKLKAEKLNEISMLETSISALSSESIANVPLSENEKIILAGSEADVNQLDASTAARLESRIERVSTDQKYLKIISNSAPEYHQSLATAELSGLSAPEISEKRIALNEQLIVALSEAEKGIIPAGYTADDILELRRIKTLELQQDRQILEGRLAYNPRSKEGKEYAAMLATTTVSENEKAANVAAQPETKDESSTILTNNIEKVSISPEMAQSLAEPFSRDLIMPGYEDRLSAKASTKPEQQLERRIAANTSLISALQSEISIYAAAAKAPGNENSTALKLRYEELLSERSSLVDEISADKKMLEELTLTAKAEPEKTEVKGEKPAKVVVASAKNLPLAAVEVAAFKTSFAESQRIIQGSGIAPYDERIALAEMSRQQAESIETRIGALAVMLDRSTTPYEQDQIQLAIQELSALSADKLQEADRLTIEAGNIATTVAIIDEPAKEPIAQNLSAKAETKELEVEALLVNTAETMELGSMAYKSLNASIRANDLDEQMKLLASERAKSEKILISYGSETDPVLKAQLYDDFITSATDIAEIQNEVKQEISKSNESEIAFYTNSNTQLISKVESESVLTDIEVARLNDLKIQWSELSKSLESISSRSKELSVMSPADQNALLRGEIMVVSQLAAVNSQVTELSQKIDMRAAEEVAGLAKANDASAAFESNPTNHVALPNKTYTTPVVAKYAALIPETEIRTLKASDEALNFDLSIGLPSTAEADAKLIKQAARADETTMTTLQKNPAFVQYLSAKIKTDSLKSIEYSLADQALIYTTGANERFEEAKRLNEAVAAAENQDDKKMLLEQSSRIAAEAEVLYKKASIAATGAEEARSLRTAQQQNIAAAVSSLKAVEISDLDKVLKGEPYKIITADLASNQAIPAKNNAASSTVSTPGNQNTEGKAASKTGTSGGKTPDEDDDKPIATYWLGMIDIIAEKNNFSDVKENMFVSTETSIYSKAKPIPMNPPMPSGLIFQVQVGAFRNPIPQDMFKAFAPVMGQRLDNGITRYRAGIFTIYRDAVAAKDAIRQLGYKDAFVIAYLDGERLSAEEARAIVNRLPQAETRPSAAPITAMKQPPVVPSTLKASKPENTSVDKKPAVSAAALPENVEYYNDPNAAAAAPVEVIAGLFYTVQVGVYSKPVALDKLYNLTELNTELTAQKTIRYTTGRFNSVGDASLRKQAAQSLGVTDAFVTAYYNGRRISPNEANALLKEQGDVILALKAQKPVQVYVVVLGVFSGDVPQEFANTILERPELNIRSISESNEISIFISAEFADKQSAEEYLQKAIKVGLREAYLARWVNGKAIR